MQLKEISLEDVFPSESNPRQDFGDIEAFADSFEDGQPNIPIIVAQEGGIRYHRGRRAPLPRHEGFGNKAHQRTGVREPV